MTKKLQFYNLNDKHNDRQQEIRVFEKIHKIRHGFYFVIVNFLGHYVLDEICYRNPIKMTDDRA